MSARALFVIVALAGAAVIATACLAAALRVFLAL